MPKFSLVPYTIRIKDVANGDYIFLGDKNNSAGLDLLDILENYLNKCIPSLPPDLTSAKNNQVIYSEQYNRSDRRLNGILKCGEYGYASDLLDINSDAISYNRQRTDAELMPYYYLTKIPTTTQNGIIVFQKSRNLGVKDIFCKDFKNHFGSLYQGYTLEMDQLIPTDLVKRYLSERIIKIRFIKYGFPRDIADISLDAIPLEEEGESEFILKARKNGSLPQILADKLRNGIDKFLGESNMPVGSILEIKDFQADNIKVEVQVGGSHRTVDLSNLDRLRFADDISDKVTIDSNTGHPNFDSIDKLAELFLNDLASAIWGEVDHV